MENLFAVVVPFRITHLKGGGGALELIEGQDYSSIGAKGKKKRTKKK